MRVALNSLILVVASYFVGALILIRDMLRLKSMSSGSLIRRDRLIGRVHALCGAAHLLRVSLPRLPGAIDMSCLWRCSR